MEGKTIKVCVGVPTKGTTDAPAYDNHLTLLARIGKLEIASQLGVKEVDGEKFDYPDGVKFKFLLTTLPRIFPAFARERIADEAREQKCDYLFFFDDDMIMMPDLFERLFRHQKDIVAALAFTRLYPYNPVIYNLTSGYDGVEKKEYYINTTVNRYPKDQLVECDAVGFGAVLIDMKTLEKIPKYWFMTTSGAGEDIHFCMKKGIVYGDFEDISKKPKDALTHTGVRHNVTEYFEREYDGELVRITPLGTEDLEITPNHPVLIFNGHKQEWKDAGKLDKSDMLFSPIPKMNDYEHIIDLTPFSYGACIKDEEILFTRTHKTAASIPAFPRMNKDLAYLFGYYVAEGNSTKNNVVFSYNAKTEKKRIQRIKKILSKNFEIKTFGEYIDKGTNSGHLTITNAVLARFFRSTFGHGANNKRFPVWIADNKRFCTDVLNGLFDGDGHLNRWGLWSLITTSQVLAHQVKNIFSGMGIFASIGINDSNVKNGYSRSYRIRPYKKDTKLIIKKLMNGIEGWSIPIKKIIREKFKGMVYNLGVSPVESYIINGISVHNCQQAKKAGFRVFMDTSTKIGHLGEREVVTEETYEKHNTINEDRKRAGDEKKYDS